MHKLVSKPVGAGTVVGLVVLGAAFLMGGWAFPATGHAQGTNNRYTSGEVCMPVNHLNDANIYYYAGDVYNTQSSSTQKGFMCNFQHDWVSNFSLFAAYATVRVEHASGRATCRTMTATRTRSTVTWGTAVDSPIGIGTYTVTMSGQAMYGEGVLLIRCDIPGNWSSIRQLSAAW